MSETHINKVRPNKCIDTILDKDYNKIVPKSVNNHPEFDINYLRTYVINYNSYYANQFKKVLEVKKWYDNLSIIRSHEISQQWAIHVRVVLQALITEKKKESFYHVFCLFISFKQGYQSKDILYNYHRPSVHKSRMAICFDC